MTPLPYTRLFTMALLAMATATPAIAQPAATPSPEWATVLAEARGETVYFNAWGGGEQINAYIAWAGQQVESRFGVQVVHVKLSDTAEAVNRVRAEKAAGRATGGSVDLVWINGENFKAMKDAGLLGPSFATALPNFASVDTQANPTTIVDFTVPTDGLEAPWGMAQLVFYHDSAIAPTPPRSIDAFLDYAVAHPGRVTYPSPPDFLGSTFLKQALIALTPDPAILSRPPDDASFAAATAPLWAWLDALRPNLWRKGETYPQNVSALRQLVDDGELDVGFTFNPGDPSAMVAQGLLPQTTRAYGLSGGTIANTHFVAIPFNANARAGAMVLADFLLSPEAQAHKADPRVWGDPTVLSMPRLSADERALFAALPTGTAAAPAEDLVTALPEPHPDWMSRLEREWARRFAS
jgi:putative thiamine transport system substrate-binding protein